MVRPLADDGILRRIIDAAGAAPSIHNTQPWRFVVTADDMVEIHGDPDRMLWVADPRGRALHLSCGAALFNLRLAIRMTGSKPLVWPLPEPQGRPTLLAIVQAEPGRPATSAERELFGVIWQRHTNRDPFSDRVIPDSVQVALEQAAGSEFAVLRMLSTREAAMVIDMAARADQELAKDFDHRAELGQWIAAGGRDDGVPAAALGARPERQPAPVRDLSYASPVTWRPEASFERIPQLAVLATARDEAADWLRAGQALQRVLLTATGHGVRASFLYQQIELHDRRETAGAWWPWPENPQLIIRLGYGSAAPGSPRRPMEDILVRAQPGGSWPAAGM